MYVIMGHNIGIRSKPLYPMALSLYIERNVALAMCVCVCVLYARAMRSSSEYIRIGKEEEQEDPYTKPLNLFFLPRRKRKSFRDEEKLAGK